MSLFDVLRYPVSDFPRESELNNIPVKIWQRYIKSRNIGYMITPEEEYNNFVWCYYNNRLKELKKRVALLRRIIERWEDK